MSLPAPPTHHASSTASQLRPAACPQWQPIARRRSSEDRSNKELIGQGLGNAASGLFGGLASAGATVRSVVNIRSGGRTALSAATHSVILLALVVGLGAVVQYIPLAVLSGILILTAVGMFDWEGLRKAHVSPRGDIVVMFATMIVTVLVDLTVAVAVGVALALVVHVMKSRRRKASVVHDGADAYRIEGPLSLSVKAVLADATPQQRPAHGGAEDCPHPRR
ncbi:hypothetical protein GCM10023080_017880 [Streptomyces pseudoechinosporeus]